MFDYDPMTKEAATAERYSILPDGVYSAKILSCLERTSNTGNPMFELNLEVYELGKSRKSTIKDFLLFTTKMMWKTINCCEACGLMDAYLNKTLEPRMLEGKRIMVDVRQQEGQLIPLDKLNGKEYGSKYPVKNVINDYVVNEETKGMLDTLIEKEKDDLNDDIPF